MKITVVAHCLLNPLTRVKGLSPREYQPDGNVIQLPCPEFVYLGPDRWAMTRNQYDVPEYRRLCRMLIRSTVDTLELLDAEVEVIGIRGSPSCGVTETTEGYEGGRPEGQTHHHVKGMGVFMEELAVELERRGIQAVFNDL